MAKQTAPLQSQFSRLTRVMAAFTASLFLVSSQLALPAQANELNRAQFRDLNRQEWRQLRLEHRQQLQIPENNQQSPTVTVTPGAIPNPTLNSLQIDRHQIRMERREARQANRPDSVDRATAKAQRAGVRADRVQAHQAHVNAVRADRLSSFVIQENAGQIIRLDNGANLDLTASNADITIGDKLIADGGFVTIKVGGETKNVYAGSKVTAAEYVAVKQAISGSQTLVVDSNGKATGGTVDLNTIAATKNTMKASSLTVGSGVTAVGDLDKHSTFKLDGDLINSGSIYAVNTKGNNRGVADITADNISNNEGGLISSNAGSQFGNKATTIDLNLTANNNFSNKGTIESSGDLSISAGNSITNGSGSQITANNNLNLSSKTIANAGTISSTTRDITVDAPVGADLNVDNTNGTLQALQGAINVRAPNYNGTNNSTINGGDLLSKQVNMHTGLGTTNINVGQLTGEVTGTGTAAHVEASTENLLIGSTCLTGDPTYKNSAGNIVFTGDVTVGEALAVLASGNITTNVAGTLNITARDAAGNGRNILMAAGFTVSAGGTDTANITGNPPPGATGTNTTVSNAGAGGGNINLSNAAVVNINANAVGAGDGGSVQLYARQAGANDGRINLPTAGGIFTAGSGFGSLNGDVNVIAGVTNGTAVTLPSIVANGGAGTVGGSISVQTAQASANGVTVAPNGEIIAGNFSTVGPLTANGGIVIGGGVGSVVNAHNNILVQAGTGGAILNAATVSTLGGNITLTSVGGNATLQNTSSVTTFGGDLSVTGANARQLSAALGAIDTRVGTLGGGNVTFTATTGAASINSTVNSGVGDISLNGSTAAQVSGNITTNNGNVSLVTATGNVLTQGNITTNGGNVTLTATAGDVLASTAGTSINTSGGLGGNVDITSGATRLISTLAITTGGGNVNLLNGAVNVGGAINASLGTTGGFINITTTNNNVNLGGNLTAGNPGISLDAGTGTITANNGVVFTANGFNLDSNLVIGGGGGQITIAPLTNGTNINVGTNAPLGISTAELNLISAGTLVVGNGGLTGDIDITAPINVSGAGPGNFNLVFNNAGNFNQGGNSITLGARNMNVTVLGNANLDLINSTTGSINVSGRTGVFTNNNLSTTTGQIVLTSLAGDVNTNGDTVSTTTGNITYSAALNIRTADVTSNGGLISMSSTGGNVNSNGGTLSTFNNSISLQATAGNIQTDNVTITGTGNLTLNASGNIDTTPGTLSTTSGTVSVIAGNGVTLNDVNTTTGPISVTSNGANGTTANNLTSTSGAITLITALGQTTTNNLTTGGSAAINVTSLLDANLNNVSTFDGDINITSTSGNVSTRDLSSSTNNADITVNAVSDITTRDINMNGGILVLNAPNNITTRDISGIGNALGLALSVSNNLSVRNVLVNGATQSINLIAGNSVNTGNLQAISGFINLQAGNDITGGGNLQTNGNFIALNAGDSINVGNVTTIGGTFTVSATGDVTTGNIAGIGNDLLINTGGNISIGNALFSLAGQDITLTSTGGDVFSGNLQALGGVITISAFDQVIAGDLTTTTGGISVTGGSSVDTGFITTSTGNILVSAGNLLTILGDITTTSGDITLNSTTNSIFTDSLITAGTILVTAGQDIDSLGGVITAGGNVTLAAGRDVTTDDVTSGGGTGISITAGRNTDTDQGTLTTNAGGAITIVSGNNTRTDNITSNTGAISITSGGNTNGTNGTYTTGGAGTVDINSGGDTSNVSVVADLGNVGITSGGSTDVSGNTITTGAGNITIASTVDTLMGDMSSTAGGNISVTAGGGIFGFFAGADLSTTTGNITLTAGGLPGVGFGSLTSASGDIQVAANGTGANILGGTVTTGGAGFIDLSANATTIVGNITKTGANGRVQITSGANTIAGNITSSGNGRIEIDSVGFTTTGALTKTGAGFIDVASGNFTTINGNVSTGTGNITIASTGNIAGVSNTTVNGNISSTSGVVNLSTTNFDTVVNGGITTGGAGTINITSGFDTVVTGNLGTTGGGNIQVITGANAGAFGDANLGSVSVAGGAGTVLVDANHDINIGTVTTAGGGAITLDAGHVTNATGNIAVNGGAGSLIITSGLDTNTLGLSASTGGISVTSTTGSLTAVGAISTTLGNITLTSGFDTNTANVTSAGGNIDVASGHDTNGGGTALYSTSGAGTVSVNSAHNSLGFGATTVNGNITVTSGLDSLFGTNNFNSSTGDIALTATTGDLVVNNVITPGGDVFLNAGLSITTNGVVQADPIVMLSGTDINLGGNVAADNGILLVAGGNITGVAASVAINGTSAIGNAGDVTLVAGANFTNNGTSVTINGSSGTGGNITGNITSISANSTAAGGNGGDVTLAAFNAGAANGTIAIPANILTSGQGLTGVSGNVVVVAGNTGVGGTAIQVGNISTTTSAAGLNGSGDVALVNVVPTGGFVVDTTAAVGSISGTLFGNSISANNVVAGNIRAAGADVLVFAGQNAQLGTVNVSDDGTAGANAGTILLQSNGTLPFSIGGAPTGNSVAGLNANGSGAGVHDAGLIIVNELSGNGIVVNGNSVSASALNGDGGVVSLNAGAGVGNVTLNGATINANGTGFGGAVILTGRNLINTGVNAINANGGAVGGDILIDMTGGGTSISIGTGANQVSLSTSGAGAGSSIIVNNNDNITVTSTGSLSATDISLVATTNNVSINTGATVAATNALGLDASSNGSVIVDGTAIGGTSLTAVAFNDVTGNGTLVGGTMILNSTNGNVQGTGFTDLDIDAIDLTVNAAGNVLLNELSGINFVGSSAAGNTFRLVANNDITGAAGHLVSSGANMSLTSSNGNIGVDNLNRFNVSVGTDLSANAPNGSVFIQGVGDLNLGGNSTAQGALNIRAENNLTTSAGTNLTANNIVLRAQDGAIQFTAPTTLNAGNTINLRSNLSILNGNLAGTALVANNVILTSDNGSIGAFPDPGNIVVTANNVTANAAGDIHIHSTGSVNLTGNWTAGGLIGFQADTGNMVISGNLVANDILTQQPGGSLTISGTLTAANSVTLNTRDNMLTTGAGFVTANDVFLNTNYVTPPGPFAQLGNIGSAGNRFQMNAVNLVANAAGGSIFIDDTAGGINIGTVLSFAGGNFDVVAQGAGGFLSTNGAIQAGGNVRLVSNLDSVSVGAGIIALGDVTITANQNVSSTAAGTINGDDVAITATNGGLSLAGAITGNTISLTSNNTISNTSVGTLNTPVLSLTSTSGSVGTSTAARVNLNVGSLTVNAAQDVFVFNNTNLILGPGKSSAGAVNTFDVLVNGTLTVTGGIDPAVVVLNSSGDLQLNSLITATVSISATSTGGSVLDTPQTGLLVAPQVTLSAANGFIGAGPTARINIDANNLRANAQDVAVGDSDDLNINGTSSATGVGSFFNVLAAGNLSNSATITSAGNVVLQSTGGTIDLNANVSAASNAFIQASGNVNTAASASLTALTAQLTSVNGDIGGAGNRFNAAVSNGLSVTANSGGADAFIHGIGSLVLASSSAAHELNVHADNDLTLGAGSTQQANIINFRAIGGGLDLAGSTITASNRVNLRSSDTIDSSAINGATINTPQANLTSDAGNIFLGPLDLNVASLTANAFGNVDITTTNGVNIGPGSSSAGGLFQIVTGNNGLLSVTGTINANAVVLDSDGALSIQNAVTGTTSVQLEADASILNADLAGGIFTANLSLRSNFGSIGTAAQRVIVDTNFLTVNATGPGGAAFVTDVGGGVSLGGLFGSSTTTGVLDILATGGDLTVVSAATSNTSNVVLGSTGNVTVNNNVTANQNVNINAGANINLTDDVTATNGGITLTATGDITSTGAPFGAGAVLQASTTVTGTGVNITIGDDVTTTNGDITFTASNNLTIGQFSSIDSGNDLNLTANAALSVTAGFGGVNADNDININAGGTVTLVDAFGITAGNNLNVIGGTVLSNENLNAGNDVSITGVGAVAVNNTVNAVRDVNLVSLSTVTTGLGGTLTAGRDVAVGAFGNVLFGDDVTAANNVTVVAPNVNSTSAAFIFANNNVNLQATTGAFDLDGGVGANNTINLRSNLGITNANVSGGLGAPQINLTSDTGDIGTNVGSRLALDFQSVSATATAGSVFLSDTSGNLNIGGAPSFAAGFFDVLGVGDLTTSDTILAGAVILRTTGGNLSNNATIVGGNVDLRASNNVSINADVLAFAGVNALNVRADNGILVLNADVTGDAVSLRSGSNMTSPLGVAIGNTVTLLSDNGNIGTSLSPFVVDTTSITANAPNGSAWVRDISTAATINIQQSNALNTLSFVGTNNVNVAGQLTATDINVQSTGTFFFINANVIATNSVTLQSRFGISDANFFSTTSIQAPNTTLITDVGSIGAFGNTLDLNLNTVNFSAPTGDVYFFDPTGLTIGTATTNSLGTIDVTANGALATTSAITSGNVILTSLNSSLTIGGNINANFAADLTARNNLTTTGGAVVTAFDVNLLSTNGNIGTGPANRFAVEANDITANAPQGSIFIDANATSLSPINFAGASNAFGTLDLVSGGNITQDVGSTVTALNINLNSGGQFILGGTFTATGTINATSVGSILASGVGPTTFSATNLNLTSTTGFIGFSAGSRLVVDADNLTATANNGSVFIDGGAGLLNIGLGSSSALNTFDVVAGTLSNNGTIFADDVVLTSTVGGITVNNNITGISSVTLNSATTLQQFGGTIFGGALSISYTAGNPNLNLSVDTLTTNAPGSNLTINNTGNLVLLSQNVNNLTVNNFGGSLDTGANITVGGNLVLSTSGGDLNLFNNISAGNNVTLTASTGTITQAAGQNIDGALLSLNWATSNVTLFSTVDELTASSPGNDLTLTNTGDIILGATNLANLTLIANSDITVNAAQTQNNLTLQANTGSIILNASVTGTTTATLRAFNTIIQNAGSVNGGALTLSYNLGPVTLSTDVASVRAIAFTDTNAPFVTFDPSATTLTINEANSVNVLTSFVNSLTVNAGGNININGDINAAALARFNSTGGNIVQAGGFELRTDDLQLVSNGTITILDTFSFTNTQQITVTGSSVANVTTGEFGTVILNASSATSLFLDASDSTEVTTAGNTTVSQFLDITTPRLNNQFALSAGNILSVQSPTGDLVIDGGAGAGSLTGGTSVDLTATSGDLIFFGNQNFFGVANLSSNPNPPFGSIVISAGANVVGNLAVNLYTCDLQLIGNLQGNPINYFCATGGGTIANSIGNVVLTSDINLIGKNFAIIASGSIIASGINNINLSSPTGDGGTLTMLAGFDFTPGTGGQLNNTPILFTVNGPSATGGNIALGTVNINTSSSFAGGNGGNVFAAAVDGAVFNGDITLGNIDTTSATGNGGVVTVLAGGNLTTNGTINTFAPGGVGGAVNLQVTNPAKFGGNVYVANGDIFGPGFIDGTGLGADGNMTINGNINAGNGQVNILGASGVSDSITQNAVLTADTLNINAGSGTVTFNNTVINFLNSNANGNVNVDNTGFLTVVSVTGATQNLHVDNNGGLLSNSTINAGSVLFHEFSTNGILVSGSITTVNEISLIGFGGGDVTLGATGSLTTTGGGDITIDASNSGTANAFVAGSVNSSANAFIFGGNNTTINGTVLAANNVSATAGNSIFVNNTITATSGDINLNAGNALDVNAALNAGTNVFLSATNNIDTDAVTAGNNITANSGSGNITFGGVVLAGNNINATATLGSVDVDLAMTATTGTITLSAGSDVNVDGILTAGNNVSLTTINGDINISSAITATNDVTGIASNLGDINVNAAVTATNGLIDLNADGDITTTAVLNAGNTVVLFTGNGDISVGANVLANNGATLDAGNNINFTANVTIDGGSDVALFAALINGGANNILLFADDTITADTGISTTGDLTAFVFNTGSSVSLQSVNADDVVLGGDSVSVGVITSTGDTTVTAIAFTTAGNITANGDVNINTNTLTNTFTITGDNVNVTSFSGFGLTVDGGVGGTLTATGGSVNLATSTTGDITFFGATTFNGTTQITPGGAGFSVIVANGANVLGNNDVFLNTCSLILQGNGTINGNLLHFNCPNGAGTIANASGDVDLTGINLVFDGKSLAILASGNIIGGSTTLIDLSSSTGNGGNLFAVAGFDFTPGTGGVQVGPNDVLYTLAQGGGNTGGGNIDFSTLNIITNGIGSGNGGNVTLVASGGNNSLGTVTFNNITTTGGISGNDGNVLVIAEGGFTQLGTITNPGGTVTLAAATPTIVGGNILVGNGENLGPGTFSFGPPTAAGTIANSNGDVDLTGLNLTFVGLNLAIIASGDVIAGTNTSINLSNPAGNGGTLLVVAGFDFTPATAGQVNFNAGTTYTFGSGSTSGGDIDFTGLTITTSATNGNAGDVTLVAKAGGTNFGTITTGNINAVGTGAGALGGDILVIAEGGFTISGVANTGTAGNGTTQLAAATPLITGGPITVQNGTQGGTGAFTFTAPTGAGTIANSTGDVNIATNLNFTGLSLAILASGNINMTTGLTINLSDSSAFGGNLTMVAGYDFTPATPGQVTDTTQIFTLGNANATGGSINMSGVNISTSGLLGGGDVIAVANGGTTNNGSITLGGISAGSASGAAGDVTLIGEGGITTGAISNTGVTGGNVTMSVSQAQTTGTVTVQNGNLLSGGFTAGTSLTSGNVSFASINAGNDVSISANNAAGITLNQITAGSDIDVVNTGSITIAGAQAATTGSVNITANDVAGAATLMNVNANITAGNQINIINTGTDRKLDRFTIATGVQIVTNAPAKTTNEGDINLRLGAVSNPLNNSRLPSRAFQVNLNGGAVTLFGGKPRGNNQNQSILNTIGADINITNALKGKAFLFQGGNTVTADPPVAAAAFTANATSNGRSSDNAGHNGQADVATALDLNLATGTNLNTNVLDQVQTGSTITGADALSNNNGASALTVNALTANGNGQGVTLTGGISEGEDNSYMVSSTTGPVKEAEASICTDADLGTTGSAAHIAHNDRVVLKQGNVLFVPFRDTVVETPQGNVTIQAKSVALVSVSNDKVAVYDIDDSHKGAVTVEAQGQKITLAPGNHLTVATAKSGEFAQVNAIEAIPHRNVATKVINNGVKLHTSEFSVASAIQSVKPLQVVMGSKHPQAKKVADRMMKTTAVLLTLGGKGEFQHFFKPAITAMK